MARVYKASAIYDARIAGMRNLWEPSTEFNGRPVDKPNYLVSIVMKKTRANWYEEPALTDFAASCKAIYDAAMSHIPFQQIEWPIKDGDLPDNQGRPPADWRVGNWILNGSSTSPIEVTINQNGVLVPLKARLNVKPGDHVSVTTSVAVSGRDPKAIKCYINKVAFLAPGEEMIIGTGSVSNTELMTKAKEQGLNVTGFGSGAPQQGFTAGGFAPPPASSVPSPGQAGAAPSQGGNAAFPSSVAPAPVPPPPQQGFTAPPAGWGPPTGFPPRQ